VELSLFNRLIPNSRAAIVNEQASLLLFTEHFSYDEDEYGSAKATAQEQIQQRIACCGQNDCCNHTYHSRSLPAADALKPQPGPLLRDEGYTRLSRRSTHCYCHCSVTHVVTGQLDSFRRASCLFCIRYKSRRASEFDGDFRAWGALAADSNEAQPCGNLRLRRNLAIRSRFLADRLIIPVILFNPQRKFD
jgi:hypothetical protein